MRNTRRGSVCGVVEVLLVKYLTRLYSYGFHRSLLNGFITGEYKYDDMGRFIFYVRRHFLGT